LIERLTQAVCSNVHQSRNSLAARKLIKFIKKAVFLLMKVTLGYGGNRKISLFTMVKILLGHICA